MKYMEKNLKKRGEEVPDLTEMAGDQYSKYEQWQQKQGKMMY